MEMPSAFNCPFVREVPVLRKRGQAPGALSHMTNFVVKAGRSSLSIFPGHWPESESSLGVGTGINGYLDRLTEEAASVVRPEASPGGGGSYRLQGNAA